MRPLRVVSGFYLSEPKIFLPRGNGRVQTLPLLKEKDFEGKSENFSSVFPPTQCVQAIQRRFLSPSQWLSCHCKSVFTFAFLLAWIGPDDGSGTIRIELVSMFSGDKDVGWKHGHLETFKYLQDTMYMMGFPYVRFTCPWASGRFGGGGEREQDESIVMFPPKPLNNSSAQFLWNKVINHVNNFIFPDWNNRIG